MIKRVVIAGCRKYENYNEAKPYIDLCLCNIKKSSKIIIVSGCANGADAIGERYAQENRFEIEKYPADWKKYGRCAGPKRNEEMAKACDYVICFWDGKSKGTKNMIDNAKKLAKPIRIKYINL